MATVILLDDNIKVKASIGTTLRKIADKTGASMEFGCRVGDCTTCVAHVKSGMDFMNQKNEKEERALAMLDTDITDLRLMCQCQILSDEGEIVIAYERA
jgi:ferredoxin